MKCIACKGETDVYDSRLLEGNQFRRKRRCRSCAARFSTLEVLEGRLATPAPRVAKPEPKQKPKRPKVHAPKREAKPIKPRRPEDDFDFEMAEFNAELRDIANELGIEGFR